MGQPASAQGDVPRICAELRGYLARKIGNDPVVERLTTQLEVWSATAPTLCAYPELDLPRKEQQILNLLNSKPGRVFSRESIMNALYFDRADDAPEPKIVDVFITRIRNKLREKNMPVWIETLWGLGWRLVNKPARSAPIFPTNRRIFCDTHPA